MQDLVYAVKIQRTGISRIKINDLDNQSFVALANKFGIVLDLHNFQELYNNLGISNIDYIIRILPTREIVEWHELFYKIMNFLLTKCDIHNPSILVEMQDLGMENICELAIGLTRSYPTVLYMEGWSDRDDLDQIFEDFMTLKLNKDCFL